MSQRRLASAVGSSWHQLRAGIQTNAASAHFSPVLSTAVDSHLRLAQFLEDAPVRSPVGDVAMSDTRGARGNRFAGQWLHPHCKRARGLGNATTRPPHARNSGTELDQVHWHSVGIVRVSTHGHWPTDDANVTLMVCNCVWRSAHFRPAIGLKHCVT